MQAVSTEAGGAVWDGEWVSSMISLLMVSALC